MNNPLVSIVLPTYNGEEYISRAIQSIINQTYTNWELIIVNDCSVDSTSEIINNFSKQDSRIKVINNDKNMKLPASLNRGFKEANGEYYTWTSDDNEYYPEAIAKMVSFLNNNSDFGMVYAICKVVGSKPNDCWGDVATTPMTLLGFPTPAACFLYRASIAKAVGEYDPCCTYYEDHDYWLRLFLKAPIGNIPEELYMYRRHQNSLTVKSNDKAAKVRILTSIKYLSKYIEKFPAYKYKMLEEFELLKAIYEENDSDYERIKKIYSKKQLYFKLKIIYRITNSKWQLNKIKQLGLFYKLKAIKLFLKGGRIS